MADEIEFVERPHSKALAWSIALACIPTAVVATMIAWLLFPRRMGEEEFWGGLLAFMIAIYGGVIVLICSIAGVILAMVHLRRTKSNLGWIGFALNLLIPLIIPGLFVLKGHLLEIERNAPIYPYINRAAEAGDIEGIKKNIKKGYSLEWHEDKYALFRLSKGFFAFLVLVCLIEHILLAGV